MGFRSLGLKGIWGCYLGTYRDAYSWKLPGETFTHGLGDSAASG